MELTPVKSSNVEAVGYDHKARELHVRFKGGGTYVYAGVAPEEHAALMAAPSIGSHIHARIKSAKKARKL